MFSITPEEVKDTHYKDLVSIFYNKIRENPNFIHRIDIQYSVKDGESCIWSLEMLDEQDINDACIFARGLASVNDDKVQLTSMKLSSAAPGSSDDWGGRSWREKGGSQAQPERS